MKVIYDIGANIGTWTLLAKAVLPNTSVHAFEPLEKHCIEFGKSTTGLENVYLHKCALGPKSFSANMHVTTFSDASSLLEIAKATEDIFGVFESSKHEVQVTSLDEYILSNNLPFPDLMKLDIQGYELEALKGANLCMKHVKYLICEVSFIEFYREQALFHDIVAFLSQHDFYLEAFSVNTQLGQKLYQTDALFIKKTSLPIL